MSGNVIISDGLDGQYPIGPLCLTRDDQSILYEKMLSDITYRIAMVIWRSAGINSHLYFNPTTMANR